MAVNKVVYGNDTLIDLTEDTVQPEDVALGETFHDRSGVLRTGTSSGTGGVPIELLEDTVGWIGKNLIPNHGDDESNGITWTVNADGSITAIGSTGNSSSKYVMNVPSDLVGNFYFSGCPENGSNSTYDVYAYDNTTGARCKKWNGTNSSESDLGQGNKEVQFVDGHSSTLNLRINSNQSNVNKTFHPMIRRASISDSTFEPYHEDVDTYKANNSALAPVENGSTASQAYAQGAHFIHNGQFCTAKTAIASGATLTENSNYTVGDVASAYVPIGIQLSSSDDLDNIVKTGIYSLTSQPAHSPDSYCSLIVEAASDTRVRQLIFKGGVIYSRIKSGSPAAWQNWYKFEGTIVS